MTNRPKGYRSKAEVAAEVGVSEKTLDRRRKQERVLQNTLKAGRNIWFPEADVLAYLKLTRERGRV